MSDCSCSGSEPERLEGVEQAVGGLQVHVVAGSPGRAVSALEVQDLLRDASGDGSGEAAFASGYAGKAVDVGSARLNYPAKGVPEHVDGEGRERWNRAAARTVGEA